MLFFYAITLKDNKKHSKYYYPIATSIIIRIFAIEIATLLPLGRQSASTRGSRLLAALPRETVTDMIYKGIDIQRKDANYVPGPLWKMCGYDYDYGMFRSKTPRDCAVLLIHSVFTDEEIRNKRFIYLPRTYRGRQSMKDSIEIYYKEKGIWLLSTNGKVL